MKHMTVPPAEGRYVTGIHRAPSESVDFVIQTILVMVFNPRLKFFFFFFLSPPFLFFSLNKGISTLAGFREAQRREKQVSARRGEKKKRDAVSIPCM